jgi:hypothetical protein
MTATKQVLVDVDVSSTHWIVRGKVKVQGGSELSMDLTHQGIGPGAVTTAGLTSAELVELRNLIDLAIVEVQAAIAS